jgi:hypothetical protein
MRGTIHLQFVFGQLSLFNKTVLHIEKTSLNATEVVYEPKSLKTILQERKEKCFIAHGGNYWYGN